MKTRGKTVETGMKAVRVMRVKKADGAEDALEIIKATTTAAAPKEVPAVMRAKIGRPAKAPNTTMKALKKTKKDVKKASDARKTNLRKSVIDITTKALKKTKK